MNTRNVIVGLYTPHGGLIRGVKRNGTLCQRTPTFRHVGVGRIAPGVTAREWAEAPRPRLAESSPGFVVRYAPGVDPDAVIVTVASAHARIARKRRAGDAAVHRMVERQRLESALRLPALDTPPDAPCAARVVDYLADRLGRTAPMPCDPRLRYVHTHARWHASGGDVTSLMMAGTVACADDWDRVAATLAARVYGRGALRATDAWRRTGILS